jgi:ribonuclease D
MAQVRVGEIISILRPNRFREWMTARKKLNHEDLSLRFNPYNITILEQKCDPKWYNNPKEIHVAVDQIPLEIPRTLIRVTDDKTFLKMINHLALQSEIMVDVEGYDGYSILGMTATIQIQTMFLSFIIDPIKCFNSVTTKLKRIMEAKHILKVVHGGQLEIKAFQRDFNTFMFPVIDTQIVEGIIREMEQDTEPYFPNEQYKQTSLASLIQKYLGIKVDKSIRRENWLKRNQNGYLPSKMELYAQDDVYYLLQIWYKQREKLSQNFNYIDQAFQKSKSLSLIAYRGNKHKQITADGAWERYVCKFNKPNRESLFKELHQLRRNIGFDIDEKQELVWSDADLLSLVEHRPTNEEQLSTALPTVSYQCRKHIKDVFQTCLRNRNIGNCWKCSQPKHFPTTCQSNPAANKAYYNSHPDKKKYQRQRRNKNHRKNLKIRGIQKKRPRLTLNRRGIFRRGRM